MRINEILTESQLQQIDEGPKLDAAGRAIGGVVSGAAKGLGALAGGVRGAFTALKKGYQTGKAIVGDDPDPNARAPGYTAPTPSTTPPSAADINAQGPKGTAPAKAQTGQAGAALAKTDAVTDKQTAAKAGETVYAQVKANIDKLDKKGKQRILQLLTKSVAAPAPKAPAAAPASKAPAADPAAAPDANAPAAVGSSFTYGTSNGQPDVWTKTAKGWENRGSTADGSYGKEIEKAYNQSNKKPAADPAAAPADPGAAAFGQMANTLTKEPTKAAAPAADPAAPAGAPADPAAAGGKLTPAQQAAKVAELKGKRAAGKTVATSTTGGFGKAVAAAKEKGIATASKINYGNALSEALAQRVEMHKQKMFETGLAHGTASIFRK